MKDYRLYRLKAGGGIKSGEDFRADNDVIAIAEAQRMAAKDAVEVWQGARRVARIEAQKPIDPQ